MKWASGRRPLFEPGGSSAPGCGASKRYGPTLIELCIYNGICTLDCCALGDLRLVSEPTWSTCLDRLDPAKYGSTTSDGATDFSASCGIRRPDAASRGGSDRARVSPCPTGGPSGFRYQGYVKESGRSDARAIDLPAQSRITQWFDVEMIEVASGDVLQMRNEQFGSILDEINAKVQSSRLTIILPAAMTAIAVVASFAGQLGFFLLAVLALPLWIIGRRLDSHRRVTVLLYELSEDVEAAFARVTEAFDLMMNCSGKQWRIEAGTVVSDLATWKRNARASHLVQRSPTTLGYSLPAVIASNITPPALQAGQKMIYFFPDVALIQDGETFGAVGYADLSVTWQASNMSEPGDVPDDAMVAGWTWEHPNKAGGPDRRFRNNRQIPICCYEAMHIGSASGVNELVEFSRVGVAQAFADAVGFLPRQSFDLSTLALNRQ